MKLISVYNDRDEAELAEQKMLGVRRLASERDGTDTIYNLFGVPSWGNFLRLDMYGLQRLKELVGRRETWARADYESHAELIATIKTVAKNYELDIPAHWL